MRNNWEKEYSKAVAEVFKNRLAEKRWSQEKLATLLGENREEVNKWLNSRRPMSLETYTQICRRLEISDDEVQRRVRQRLETDHLITTPLDRSVLGPAPAFVTAEEYTKIAGELASIQEHERRALLDDAKKLLEAFRHTYKHLTERDLPWAYHVLGDVMLQRGECEAAARAFELAIEGFAIRRLDSHFQLARAYQRLARDAAPGSVEYRQWADAALKALTQCLDEDRGTGADPKIYAEHFKMYAEWVITYDLTTSENDKGIIAQVISSYSYRPRYPNSTAANDVEDFLDRALSNYRRALQRYEDQPNHLAHCHTNIAWCQIMRRQPEKALKPYVEAVRIRLDLQEEDQVAYIFKFLAVAHWAIALHHSSPKSWGMAEWCARAAVLLYEGMPSSLEDKAHATDEVLKKILASKPDIVVLPQTQLPKVSSGRQVYELYLAAADE